MEAAGTLTLSAEVFKDTRGIRGLDRESIRRADRKFLAVRVKDTGHGISKEDLSRVFNPFFSTSPKGTGLGLPIVHKLVEKNQGYIFIDSVLNQGTQVLLLLPVAKDKGKGDKENEQSQNFDR